MQAGADMVSNSSQKKMDVPHSASESVSHSKPLSAASMQRAASVLKWNLVLYRSGACTSLTRCDTEMMSTSLQKSGCTSLCLRICLPLRTNFRSLNAMSRISTEMASNSLQKWWMYLTYTMQADTGTVYNSLQKRWIYLTLPQNLSPTQNHYPQPQCHEPHQY